MTPSRPGVARPVERGGAGQWWSFDPQAEATARRLAALGAVGVGGFVELIEESPGVALRRIEAHPSLLDWIRNRPPGWSDTLVWLIEYADRLAACEARSLFPGPILPADISLAEGGPVRLHLMASVLVADLLGTPDVPGRVTPGASRWMPPEVEEGGRWDPAANRYVLGLVAYRALAGQHAFGGSGLRRAMNEQRERGAAPMPEPVARQLPPGLQSFCLRMLAPRAAERPGSAAEIRDELRRFAASDPRAVAQRPVPTVIAVEPSILGRPAGSEAAAAPRAPAKRRGRGWRSVAVVAPWLLGLGVAASLRLPDPAPATSASVPVEVRPQPPLTALSTTADDCAGCHPRQAGQWHGSVMAHSVRSPLFQALEILIEEQVGRAFDCPEGAGILRRADPSTACRDRDSGLAITGSGGEHWCVNCHAAGDNLDPRVPPWNGVDGRSTSRRPLRELLPTSTMEGISCAFCHQVHGPTRPGAARLGDYEGNPDWQSFVTGLRFASRPEDRLGRPGIANSGYQLDPAELLVDRAGPGATAVPTGAHVRPSGEAQAYLRSSEFCGACHDVRLFGTDAIGIERGEHFKRLRNAYSEWVDWAEDERRKGRTPASCQDCHMSTYPGVCVPAAEADLAASFGSTTTGATALARGCPPGFAFSPRRPTDRPQGAIAAGSSSGPVSTHYFTGVDVPLSDEFPISMVEDSTLDVHGLPRGVRNRRDLLLGATFEFGIGDARREGGRVEIPVEIQNVGAGHKVPAGFSQEREFWVHLRVTDGRGRVIYEVGRVERDDEDLPDKRFLRINVDDGRVDRFGAPLGVFGADVADGPDVPQWRAEASRADRTRTFRGLGLVNLQNGFLRCVTCIGRIDAQGRCQPGPGQGRHRADRFADGAYDLDTGECISNLSGDERFFETYFPVGALDATRGATKGPDAIIDTRSAPPGVTLRYVYDLRDVGVRDGPLTVEARLLFRAFPPFLVRAFAAYEEQQAERGRRAGGPLVTTDMLDRLEVVELHRVVVVIP